MSVLIKEYKNDIKAIRKSINKINQKKDIQIIKGKEKIIDKRTSEDKRDLTILNETLSSTQYSLWWLEHGYEKPYTLEDFNKKSYQKRTQLWGDVEVAAQYHGIKTSMELAFMDYLRKEEKNEKKYEQAMQLREILSILSPREKEYFCLKHEVVLTEEECAEKMELELGTIKSMADRIRKKIDRYFNTDFQMDLFLFEEKI